MQTHMQAGQSTRDIHRLIDRRPGDHQAGGGQDAMAMSALDRGVDLSGDSEVVGGDDKRLHGVADTFLLPLNPETAIGAQ
jgi:hypothetical protein